MIRKDWKMMFIQETWKLGNNLDVKYRGYHLFLHTMEEWRAKDPEDPSGAKISGHVEGDVGIILSPDFYAAYQRAGAPEPICTPKGKFEGRIVGLPLKFPLTDDWGKRIKGSLDIFAASIYHPVDQKEFSEFNDLLPSFLGKTM
ncbi:hypothetical protein ACHAWF_005093 [Thalassiosira exigua]